MTTDRTPPPSSAASDPRLRLRLLFGPDVMLGPGKADLLELIRDTGSISAAGRAMNMSYKRAWMLVTAMNNAFRDPLVDSARGGSKGGGATLTATGETVLAAYRALEAETARAGAAQIETIRSLLNPQDKG